MHAFNKYGNMEHGSKTGLISKQMWENLYRYYLFDLSTRDRSNNSGLSLYVTG